MNLDDYIVPTSVASPAGFATPPPSADLEALTTRTASALPIRKQQHLQIQDDHIAHASAPTIAPAALQQNVEFGYVQRHVRKTSIDERRVRKEVLRCCVMLIRHSLQSEGRIARLKYHLSTLSWIRIYCRIHLSTITPSAVRNMPSHRLKCLSHSTTSIYLTTIPSSLPWLPSTSNSHFPPLAPQ